MISKIRRYLSNLLKRLEIRCFEIMLEKLDFKYILRNKWCSVWKYPQDDVGSYINSRMLCDAEPMMNYIDTFLKGKKINIGFDLGANIGITTVWMSRFCKTVYAFEPEKRNYDRLLENIQLNGIENIKCFDLAVSDKEENSVLRVLEGYGHHSLGMVKTSRYMYDQKIKVIRLDNFINRRKLTHIDYVKIDVEGFELNVLKGLGKYLSDKKIKYISFEISEVPLNSLGKKAVDIYDILHELGYKIYNTSGKLINRKLFLEKLWFCDYLAVLN